MRSADEIVDFNAYIRAVKAGVRSTLTSMDSAATLDDTGYFNHSAVPDFFVKWGGEHQARPLYIRRSFNEILSGGDVEHLSEDGPIVLSVKEGTGDALAEQLLQIDLRERPTSRSVMIAGGRALDQFTASLESRRASGPASVSPIAKIVAAELLPEGRGLISEALIQELVEPSPGLSTRLQETFSERSFAGMIEVAEIVAASANPESPLISSERELSAIEAKGLLPWLLSSETVRRDDAFWGSIASRLSLKTIEAISSDLEGMNLTPLMPHVWDRWQPRRGYQGIVTADTPGAGLPQYWYLSGRLLTCRVGGTTLRFATYGQALKTGRGTKSSATWDAIRPLLSEFNVRELVLRGIDRSFSVNAEQSTDVQGDVDRVVESLDDQYFVDAVTVQLGLRDQNRRIRVDLGESLAFNEGSASLRDLIKVLGRVVSYREPVDVEALLASVPEAYEE